MNRNKLNAAKLLESSFFEKNDDDETSSDEESLDFEYLHLSSESSNSDDDLLTQIEFKQDTGSRIKLIESLLNEKNEQNLIDSISHVTHESDSENLRKSRRLLAQRPQLKLNTENSTKLSIDISAKSLVNKSTKSSVNQSVKTRKSQSAKPLTKPLTKQIPIVSNDDYYYGKNSDLNYRWNKKEPVINFDLNDKFEKISGLKESVKECSKLEDFFRFFIDESMVNLIVEYTNLKLFLNNIEEDPVDSIEIYGFIGLLLLFGVTKKNDVSIGEIWNSKSIDFMNYAAATISRDRFKFICQNITFDEIFTREAR